MFNWVDRDFECVLAVPLTASAPSKGVRDGHQVEHSSINSAPCF